MEFWRIGELEDVVFSINLLQHFLIYSRGNDVVSSIYSYFYTQKKHPQPYIPVRKYHDIVKIRFRRFINIVVSSSINYLTHFGKGQGLLSGFSHVAVGGPAC